MIVRELDHFNLYQIADSGQCFRMIPEPLPTGEAFGLSSDFLAACTVISGEHLLYAAQGKSKTVFFCSEEEFPFWEHYFDLDSNYSAYISSVSARDSYLKRAADFGSGIRILNQDLWEMIITFVISQQKTIPNIRALVESLSARYGTKLKAPEAFREACLPAGNSLESLENRHFFAFPSPQQLNQAALEDLLELKLGYRAKYIKRLCEDVCSKAMDLEYLKTLPYEGAMEYLQGFYGIGEKVANCICLFGLHHINAFPVDTWIRKILLEHYAPKSRLTGVVPPSRLCGALIEKYFSRYKGYAGVMQQYIFYYERNSGISQPKRLPKQQKL